MRLHGNETGRLHGNEMSVNGNETGVPDVNKDV